MQKEPFEKYWAPIATIIGAILFVINFFSALQGDKTLVTFALILVSLVAIIVGMWKYAFTLSNKPFEKNGKAGFYPRYKYHWVAKVTLLLVSISILFSVFYILTFVKIIPDCCGFTPIGTTTPMLTPTLTFTPTNDDTVLFSPTNTPTSTLASSPTETISHTLTPQPAFPDYFITNCIAYGVWDFWKPHEILPTRYDEQNRRCYDLTEWHFTAQRKDINTAVQGLRINIKSTRNIMNGIFLYLGNEAQIKLALDVEQLTSDIQCSYGEYCDANLIIGFGDPSYEGLGWFIVYRALEKDSDVYTCIMKSPFSVCEDPKLTEPGDIFLNHDLEFILNGQDTFLAVDGNLYDGPSIAGMRRQLWIGYQIRSSGTIKAFFQFK